MGTITVSLKMPAVNFVQLSDVEIRFVEDGVLRKLSLDEWKAYFPGCGNPMVYKRVAGARDEFVWWSTITDRLLPMAEAAGLAFILPGRQAIDWTPNLTLCLNNLRNAPNGFQNTYGLHAVEEDSEPPTVWTLIRFLDELEVRCRAHPAATIEIERASSAGSYIEPVRPSPNIGAGDVQVRSMSYNETRRALDRGEISLQEYRDAIQALYPGNTRN